MLESDLGSTLDPALAKLDRLRYVRTHSQFEEPAPEIGEYVLEDFRALIFVYSFTEIRFTEWGVGGQLHPTRSSSCPVFSPSGTLASTPAQFSKQ